MNRPPRGAPTWYSDRRSPGRTRTCCAEAPHPSAELRTPSPPFYSFVQFHSFRSVSFRFGSFCSFWFVPFRSFRDHWADPFRVLQVTIDEGNIEPKPNLPALKQDNTMPRRVGAGPPPLQSPTTVPYTRQQRQQSGARSRTYLGATLVPVPLGGRSSRSSAGGGAGYETEKHPLMLRSELIYAA